MRSSFNPDWFVRPKQNFFLEIRGQAAEPEAVTLPHDAMISTERDPAASHMNAYFPDGVWRYSKTFAVPDEWRDRRVRLQFEGVYANALVYLNDDFAGREPHGYGEFEIELDPFLRYGEDNTIVVECRAGDDARWYTGAGIYRPVHLHVHRPVHLAVDGLWVTTPEIDDGGAVVEIAAEVLNESPHTVTVRLASEITGENDDVLASGSVPVTVRPNSTVVARHRLFVPDPARWSIDDPLLHTCTTTLATEADDDGADELDRDVTTFGIRSLQLDAVHGLRINGETVKLRGACVHHDNGPIGAATIGRAEERRVEGLKAAGFNAIRSAHNPMSRAMLDACDRLGMVVMDETWDTWTETKRDHDHALHFDDRWRHDVASMVRKDRNHPSVVMYSTGNEIPEVGSPLGAARGRDIAEHVRALDPHRYVTTAVQPLLAIRDLMSMIGDFAEEVDTSAAEEAGVNTQMAAWAQIKARMMSSPQVGRILEEICASTDVAGYNYLDERYVPDHELYPNRVIVGSETYVTAIAEAWPAIVEFGHVIGDFTWTGWDYLGEVGIGRVEYAVDGAEASEGGVLASYPWLVAHTGDIDITGVRRPQSYFREIVFGRRGDPFIAVQRPGTVGQVTAHSGPWSWSDTLDSWTWRGFEGTELAVEVYSDADEVELIHNGDSLGRRPAGVAHGFMATFAVSYEPGDLMAISYTDGAETGRHALSTATDEVDLRVVAECDEITADEHDLAYVEILLADEAGVIDPGARAEVSATVEGPGELLAVVSADPAAAGPYPSHHCTTYEGRALAVVRPTGPGTIRVAVTAEGRSTTAAEIIAS